MVGDAIEQRVIHYDGPRISRPMGHATAKGDDANLARPSWPMRILGRKLNFMMLGRYAVRVMTARISR